MSTENAHIRIDGGSLGPKLDEFMWEILRAIDIRIGEGKLACSIQTESHQSDVAEAQIAEAITDIHEAAERAREAAEVLGIQFGFGGTWVNR